MHARTRTRAAAGRHQQQRLTSVSLPGAPRAAMLSFAFAMRSRSLHGKASMTQEHACIRAAAYPRATSTALHQINPQTNKRAHMTTLRLPRAIAWPSSAARAARRDMTRAGQQQARTRRPSPSTRLRALRTPRRLAAALSAADQPPQQAQEAPPPQRAPRRQPRRETPQIFLRPLLTITCSAR
jgi:hypothetical protein